jgi:hypothetical protein
MLAIGLKKNMNVRFLDSAVFSGVEEGKGG